MNADTENYEAPAGISIETANAPVNYSCSGIIIEDELPLSHLPAGFSDLNGMPDVVWAINQDRGLAMVFATQLLPVDDENTVALVMEFL
jgi:hypothetical protein